ncbi:MAG: type 1 glutamine amidotransferase [Bacteroidota bacterium]
MTVRLLQVRSRPRMQRQEQAVFLDRCGLRPDELLVTNVLEDALHAGLLGDVDALLIGGAGAYSVTQTYTWTQSLIDVVQACVDQAKPLFGSCWGHQFIARALGGVVIRDDKRGEMGCLPVRLTDAGHADPLFETFPAEFYANMGHQDRVAVLPAGATELAESDIAPIQAFRIDGLPIYGTQFHSELNAEAERERLVEYRSHYPSMQDDTVFESVVAGVRDTPEVDGLLKRFLELYAG